MDIVAILEPNIELLQSLRHRVGQLHGTDEAMQKLQGLKCTDRGDQKIL